MQPDPPAAGEIVCHGDLGPWNTVYRDGMPVPFNSGTTLLTRALADLTATTGTPVC